MDTPTSSGRLIGVLILIQMIGGYLDNFVLMAPVIAPPGFLVNAAGHSLQISVSAILGLATGLLCVGIAVTAFPVFRKRSETMAIGFTALAIAGFSLAAVENMNLMSMLSLSESYAKANAGDHAQFESLRGIVAASRNWAHYIRLIVDGCMLLAFYSVLFRFVLVPRALAGFGLGAVVLQISAVAMPLFGHDIVFPMLMPLGLVQLALALWLIAKGLAVTR